jgi:hypothetical protein
VKVLPSDGGCFGECPPGAAGLKVKGIQPLGEISCAVQWEVLPLFCFSLTEGVAKYPTQVG